MTAVFQMVNASHTMEIAVAEQDLSMLAEYNLTMEQLLTSSGLYADSRWFEPSTEICIVVAFCAAVGMGLLGNALVGLVLLRKGNLRSPRNWYVMNLVLSDLLICVLCIPFTLLRLTRKNWPLGEVLCRVAPTLQLTHVFVSILTILCIAVDRYCAIVCTARTRPSQQAHARLVIPAVWLLSLALSTPLALTHRLQHVRNLTGDVLLTLCVEHWESDALLGVYTVCVLLFQYVLPGATVAALHLLICRFLRTHTHLPCEAKVSRRKLHRHRKNMALLSVISLTFSLEWLPITIVNILADFDYSVFQSAEQFCLVYALCLLFALISVFVNPVLYGLFNSNFRQSLRSCCGRCTTAGGGGSGRSNTRRGSREQTVQSAPTTSAFPQNRWATATEDCCREEATGVK